MFLGLLDEIGCGDGSLGKAYKLRNPGVLYFGVELDAPSADAASKCLDGVWQGDVEKAKNFSFADQRFDCIIYGDVLEHLKEPSKKNNKRVLLIHQRMLPNLKTY